MNAIEKLYHGLIVSCQAVTWDGHLNPDDPFYGPTMMAAMAKAAVLGGAKGIRANGPADVRAIREAVNVPIIGINKIDIPGYDVRITPTFEAAEEVVRSGADIVALDCTPGPRPGNVSMPELVARIKQELGVLVMADISTLEEGIAAARAGADLVATTLSGYTPYSRKPNGPDLALVEELARELDVPIVCEGRISSPAEARKALDLGAHAVVVGAMITSPQRITEVYVRALRGKQ